MNDYKINIDCRYENTRISLVYNLVRNLIAIQLNGAEYAQRIHLL